MATQGTTHVGETLDVAGFLEGLKLTRFHLILLILSSFVTFFDGLDFMLIAYTLPYIRDEMHLTNEMMGNISSAAFLGQMIGSLVGSYFADIYGRRPVILVCTLLSALLTFVTGFAQTPEMLMVLRLFGGLAIGGLLAPAWSINIESMPASMRATSVTIIMLGFSAGGSAAGPITNFLAPGYGWHWVFFVCGALTLVLAVILQFTMPESLRWLAAKGKEAARIAPLVKRFDPAMDTGRHTSYILTDERKTTDSESPFAKFMELFHGPLRIITPLIWAAYFCSSFAIYLKASYGVLFLEQLGLSVVNATWISSAGGLVGAVAGVVLLVLTEKRGPALIALAPLIGIPFVLLIGMGIVEGGAFFIPVVLVASIMVGAGHAAVISITSIYYPSSVRSFGGGWASFMAKFASVAAPKVGAAFFLGSIPAVLNGYNFTAACLGGVVVCILVLSFFARRLAGGGAVEPEPEPALA